MKNKVLQTIALSAALCAAMSGCDNKAEVVEPNITCDCVPNSTCDEASGECVCDEGFEAVGTSCEPKVEEPEDPCEDVVCGNHEACQADTGLCECAGGYTDLGDGCEANACNNDADCDDGLSCNGVETCDTATNQCRPGAPVECTEFNELCLEETADCGCPEGYRLIDDVCTFAVCETDADCDDGLACTGIEVCDLSLNLCRRDSIPTCANNQACDEETGTCDACKPGFAPNTNGVCVASAASCDVDADCDDGNACNGRERCVNNACAAASPTNIPEGNANSTYCEPTNSDNGYTFHCAQGYRLADGVCTQIVDCATDADCDDGVFCNGQETCQNNGRCLVSGATFVGAVFCLEDNEVCIEDAQRCDCRSGFVRENGVCVRDWCAGLSAEECVTEESACPVPQAPVMTIVRNDAVLEFTAPPGFTIEVAELHPLHAMEDAAWSSTSSVDLALANSNPLRIVARTSGNDCELVNEFDWTYTLVDEYPNVPVKSNALVPGANALPGYVPAANGSVSNTRPHNPLFKGWATGWSEVIFGGSVDNTWRKPWIPLGPPMGTSGIIVLGNHGEITLTFDPPIADGEGPDFAVFENGFLVNGTVDMVFAEVAFVEVSSDGLHFLRFDTHALQPANPGAYGNMPPKMFNNIAGTQPAFWGVPFDLRELVNREEVVRGLVDLSRITHVRVIDIVGDETAVDSFGNYVFDATPTWGSGGFDLDAVGVIHQAAP